MRSAKITRGWSSCRVLKKSDIRILNKIVFITNSVSRSRNYLIWAPDPLFSFFRLSIGPILLLIKLKKNIFFTFCLEDNLKLATLKVKNVQLEKDMVRVNNSPM